MPSSVSMRTLLETGVHFGHRTTKWNPKMAPYIFTQRNGIHIIDLQQTLVNLNHYYDMLRDLTANGGTILFVGTKRQAQEIIAIEAGRCGMPHVNNRWLGGTLTNWRTIRQRIEALKKLEKRRDSGEFDLLTKKEALTLEREIAKLNMRLGGIRDMKGLPDMLLVVDTEREETAVKEANILDISVMGVVDTNANPDKVDYLIPANDDAMRSIKLLIGTLADAIAEGRILRGKVVEEEIDEPGIVDFDDEDVSDEELLGERTLAKLRDARLFDEEDKADDDDDYADDDEKEDVEKDFEVEDEEY